MATVILVRHGRTSANTAGVLAGWTPGVGLDDHGRKQARLLGERLAGLAPVAIVSSPLLRCVQTAEAIAGPRHTDDGLGECRYGAWTGRALSDLATDPLWTAVQERPSTVTFPSSGEHPTESLADMQRRAVRAVAEWDRRVESEHGPEAVWVAVSHGDVLKAVLADALGTHLDRFQRIVVDPGSLSVVQLTSRNPMVLRVNDTGTDRLSTADVRRGAGGAGDAVVGGDRGTA